MKASLRKTIEGLCREIDCVSSAMVWAKRGSGWLLMCPSKLGIYGLIGDRVKHIINSAEQFSLSEVV